MIDTSAMQSCTATYKHATMCNHVQPCACMQAYTDQAQKGVIFNASRMVMFSTCSYVYKKFIRLIHNIQHVQSTMCCVSTIVQHNAHSVQK